MNAKTPRRQGGNAKKKSRNERRDAEAPRKAKRGLLQIKIAFTLFPVF
jgi:hypothetical protein